MTITWTRGNPVSFQGSAFKPVRAVQENIDMGDIVKRAAEAMQLRIGTATGTKSGPGRVDTTLMIQSVKYRTEISNGSIVGEFGWLENQEMYFLYQDKGFTHWLSGEMIPGMMALMDAEAAARDEFVARLAAIVKFG